MTGNGVLDVVLVGGSGFLGRGLAQRLVEAGHRVTVVGRRPGRDHGRWRSVQWDARGLGPWVEVLDGCDVVVHLAGKRVDCRPTKTNIAELIESREGTVRLVGRAVAGLDAPPRAWVQLSSLAIFGDAGDQVIDEATRPPTDGPAQQVEVCRRWEAAFAEAAAGIERAVLLRPGITIGGAGDPATRQLLRLARLGLAGPVAGGKQWVSWIAAVDMFDLLERGVVDDSMVGLYHLTSPNPVPNEVMMAGYRAAANRSVGLASPAIVTRLGAWLMGSDPALALTGRRCVPTRLQQEGYDFNVTDIREAIRRAINH